MRREFSISFAVVALIAATVPAMNYLTLSKPLARVIEGDERNAGIEMAAHYQYYVHPCVLVVDIGSVPEDRTPGDVFRVLLQFAHALGEHRFDRVELAFRGSERFVVEGECFSRLGAPYDDRDPLHLMRTFAEHVYLPDGTKAFGAREGEIATVVEAQMEDFAEFHRRWWAGE